MGTLLTIGPFRIWINTDDHRPAHVHAETADGECRVSIEGPEPFVMSNDGIRPKDIKRLLRIIAEHRDPFLIAWRNYHG